MVSARYLVVTDGYCSFLVLTARYRSLLLVPTFSVKVHKKHFTATGFSVFSLLKVYFSKVTTHIKFATCTEPQFINKPNLIVILKDINEKVMYGQP